MDAKKVLEVLDIYALRIDDMAKATENDLSAKRCDPTKKYGHSDYAHRIRHVRWCADQCRAMASDGRMEKAFRWLGFMQGALWDMGLYSIEELANHNKPAAEETDLDPSRVRRFWRIAGLDLFDGTFYDLDGEFATEESAQEAACKRYDELDKTQASAGDLQDRVYIVRPDKTKYRALKARTAR